MPPLLGTGEGEALSEPGHLQVCIRTVACIMISRAHIILRARSHEYGIDMKYRLKECVMW